MFNEQVLMDVNNSLILMGQGMAGIFIGIIVIMIIVIGLGKWTSTSAENN